MSKPLVLLILDGWGIAPKNQGNAIELAKKPVFDYLWKNFPHAELKAHGKFVGLPDNQVGNSEAGHMNIGAGRVVVQDAVVISESIKRGRFFNNIALKKAMAHAKKRTSALHIMGLVSEGDSPHSSLEHLYALVEMAAIGGVEKVYLHLITDGRDSPQFSALKILDEISQKTAGKAQIVSILGRFYAMDRGKNWQRTELAYDCLTSCSRVIYKNYQEVLSHSYNQGITDEYIEPAVLSCSKSHLRNTRINDNDSLIFFNLRSDRARQLTKCFVQKDFTNKNPKAFVRKKVLKNLYFCALTDFGPDLGDVLTAFPGGVIKDTLPMILSNTKQAYIAETEKYAHMTYFINGGYADPVNGEKRVRVPSLKIKSYADKPEMSLYKVTEKVKLFIKKNYDFIAVNFANADMVGHTGNLKATIKAVEHMDKCLGVVAEEVISRKGTLIVIGDHGNAEKMLDLKTKEIWAEHTTNPVPFILISHDYKNRKLRKGSLANVAPTIYNLLNIKIKNIDKTLLK